MVESRPPCRGDEIGKHSGLKALSAQPETAGAEPFKFGETPDACIEATPSQASRPQCGLCVEGVETRRGAPKARGQQDRLVGDGEGIVQRTNGAAWRSRLRKKQCDENPPP